MSPSSEATGMPKLPFQLESRGLDRYYDERKIRMPGDTIIICHFGNTTIVEVNFRTPTGDLQVQAHVDCAWSRLAQLVI